MAFEGLKSKGEVKLNVTLASDVEGWNKTVNGQLVIELGKNPRLKLTGFVPKNTQPQREHARNLNIELVDAKDHQGFSSSELLSFPPDSLDIDILLIHSHGRDLGRQAQIIKDAKKCKWVQVVHTICGELDEGEYKLQVKLCEKADVVIAIGPKVAEACKHALRPSGKHDKVIDLTPGIFEDLNGLRQMYADMGTFHVLMSGSSKYFRIKGCDIAAKAIKLLNSSAYHLTVIVKPCDDIEEVKQALLSEGIDPRQLTVRVAESREDWPEWLCRADLAIKPSRSEGFGMSGLLAISANLPVLISEHSGLGIVLKKIPFGNASVVSSDDPKVWAQKIKQIRTKTSEIRHAEAEELRGAYLREFNWKDQCEKLVEELSRIVSQKCGDSKKASAPNESAAEDPGCEVSVENMQRRIQATSLEDKNSSEEAKVANDVVDAGVKQCHSQVMVQTRLSMYVKNIQLSVYSQVCVMLNVKRNIRFDDFRMLAEKVGLSRDETNYVEQLTNPTDEILKTWSSKSEATVGKLIEFLKEKDLDRMDVAKVLEDWVNGKQTV